MILIGQYNSSFVRRVGIALKLYGLPFEHQPWSVFSDKGKIRPFNPLMRVPVLVLDDEDVLVDSHLILTHLESLVPPERSLYPPSSPTGIARSRSPGSPRVSPTRASACSTSSSSTRRFRRSGSSAAARRYPARCPCWRKTAQSGRPNTGSAIVSCTPTSRSPAPSRHTTEALPDVVGDARLSQAPRPLRAAGGAAGLPGDQPALHPASVMPAARVLLGVKGRDCS